MSGRVFLIAHGATGLNEAPGGRDLVQGWRRDSLDEHGRQEAIRLGRRLKNAGVSLLLTSDLPRAAQTAALIGRELGLRARPSGAWRPPHMGVLEGCVSAECRPLIRQFIAHPEKEIPQGESINAFRDRFLSALKRLLSAVFETKATVAVVSHSRDLSLAQDWLAAGGRQERFRYRNLAADRIEPAAVLEMTPHGSGWQGRLTQGGKAHP